MAVLRSGSEDEGLNLDIAIWRRPAPDTAPTDSKATGLYMIATMSKHDAEARGFHDALMLDYRGYVAEATGANIFSSWMTVVCTRRHRIASSTALPAAL